MAIAFVLGGIMLLQVAGSFVGSINSANKAGQQQCKIKNQINQYSQTLDQMNQLLVKAQQTVTTSSELGEAFKNMDSVISTMRQNELQKQDEIISDYKKEISKINIISLTFIGTIFIIFLINFIVRIKHHSNC